MTPQVLDAIQLKMIQSTHRGFLYQHLFGVASLLISGETHLRELVPERDEDQELVFEAKRSYLQIKTRDRHLGVGDLEGVLERFARIRTEHSEGRRDGVPEFWIVSNVAPTQSLEDQVKQWPADVFFLSPDWVWGNPHNLPPAWRDVESAVTWCVEAASKVPFPSLAPPTMVWKLAGMIQAACAGAKLSFEVAQLPTILEQLVIQLQKFPLTPVKYRPLDDEPIFDTEERVRLVVGFSGSGKTTWAAHGSQHSGSAVVYFDVGDLPASGIAAQLAREIAASVLGTRTDQIRKLILPGTGGLQILVGLDTILKDQSSKPVVVLDNAHRAAAVDLAAIFAALPNARWIVLAQPWPGAAELETRLGIAAHSLPGWSLLTIGAVFDEQAAAIDPQLAEEFRRLTGGLPLYVQSAARVAGTAYKGNAREFCRELKQLTHLKTTGQEEILKQVQQHLTPTAADVSAVLSLADVPLTDGEVLKVVEQTLDLSSQEAGAAIRELQTWGIVHQLLDGDLVMHDAFRLLARQHGNGLGPDRLMKGREALVSILLRPREGIGHMRLLLTLLPTVGKTDVLIDVASGNSELLHELGMAVDVESMLEKARQQPDMSQEDRFWAVQTLLFWTIQNGEFAKAEEQYAELMGLGVHGNKPRQRQALALMEIIMCGLRRDRQAAKKAVKKAQILADDDEDFDRILKYNYAFTVFQCEDFEAAEKILEKLNSRYLEVLNLRPEDFLGKNPHEIAPKLGADPAILDEAKRFADVLSLIARVAMARGGIAPITSINAMKFYELSQSYRSAVKWMQDVVDQLVHMRLFNDARHFLEGVLGIFKEGYALDYLVPIYSQYAVVLAYCGEKTKAWQVIEELDPFLEGSPKWGDEVENQKTLIASIVGERTENKPAGFLGAISPRERH